MRILHLSKFYPPDSGGLERVVESLAEGAAAAGHRVRVVCAVRHDTISHPDPVKRNGVDVVRLGTYGMLWSQPIATRYLSAARWGADVVYIHRPHPLADLAALRLQTRASIIFHHSDVQRQRALRTIYQPLAHRVAASASAAVVASKYNLEFADDLGAAGRERARVIPLGVDTKLFSPGDDSPRPRIFPDRSNGPVALFVGRLVGYKGLHVLLDAVAGTDLTAVVVGSGPLEDELAARVRKDGLDRRFIMAGEAPEADLVAFYRAADYAVLPSTTPAEMFGVAALEAMACGKPVITTDLPSGVRDVNVAEETGLVVPPGDASALRAAMERLAGAEALRIRLGGAALQRARREFTIEKMVTSHLELCEELVAAG